MITSASAATQFAAHAPLAKVANSYKSRSCRKATPVAFKLYYLMGKWIHTLSNVDEQTRMADCKHCGRVKIRKHGKYWRCDKKDRKQRNLVSSKRWEKKWGISFFQAKKSYRQFLKDSCEACGFVAVDKCQMDIHHVDGNHTNNDPTNLKTLCACCHRLEHSS